MTDVSVILRSLLRCTGHANRITVNDWRLLCLTKIIDQLNYGESHTGNLLYCDSIMEGYQYSSMSKDRAFKSLFFIYSDNRVQRGVHALRNIIRA